MSCSYDVFYDDLFWIMVDYLITFLFNLQLKLLLKIMLNNLKSKTVITCSVICFHGILQYECVLTSQNMFLLCFAHDKRNWRACIIIISKIFRCKVRSREKHCWGEVGNSCLSPFHPYIQIPINRDR